MDKVRSRPSTKDHPASYLHEVIPTHPDSPVQNSQPPGIGTLESIEGSLVINNLGRNVEICDGSKGLLRQNAVFSKTAFPADDSASQYDLDMHAFLKSPGGAYLLMLNHLGMLRVFDSRAAFNHTETAAELEETAVLRWPADTERLLFLDSCLISTSSIGYGTEEQPIPGILVSDSWGKGTFSTNFHSFLTDWGEITALAADPSGTILAVAAGSHLGLFSIENRDNGSVSLGRARWETNVPFAATWVAFDCQADRLLVAGHDLSCVPGGCEDWESLSAGGWIALAAQSANVILSVPFEVDLAWGNGGIPLALSEKEQLLFGIDRHARLFAWNLTDGGMIVLAGADKAQEQTLGIAHMVKVKRSLYCGFNRGGYRLHKYSPAT